MFDQITGLPVHALVLHAAVVLVPLLAALAIVYVILPRWRDKTTWPTALTAAAVIPTVIITGLSGLAFRNRLAESGLQGDALAGIDRHGSFGVVATIFSLALAFTILLLMWFQRLTSDANDYSNTIEKILKILTVLLALVALGLVVLTGDAGARLVWGS